MGDCRGGGGGGTRQTGFSSAAGKKHFIIRIGIAATHYNSVGVQYGVPQGEQARACAPGCHL